MLKRFFRYIRALLMGKLDQMEDPEIIINESMREMREIQIKNREKAVQAITQKNNLQNLVSQEEKICADLEAKATIALKQGNEDLARQILREKGQHDATLANMRTSLQQAIDTSEGVKLAIQRAEEQFRVKTAEALALKANMKQAQIQIAIGKALDSLQSDETSQSWDRAEERIRNMQSEAQARNEIAGTSMSSKLAALQDSQVDVQADQALADLKTKLGISTPQPATETAANVTTGATATDTDVEKQLSELETKIQQTQSGGTSTTGS
ncbi:MAG: PspA/IM30 family protein [Armatimonadetes bacterium]|nr:PspA/IM30 family protein [Armatimonadota bacterium]